MEIGVKTIAAAAGIFLLGVGSTYWLMADSKNTQTVGETNTAAHHQPVMQYQPAMQHQQTEPTAPTSLEADNNKSGSNTGVANIDTETNTLVDQAEVTTLTHERFLADAEARREQQLAHKAESDRLIKLRHIKEDSVDCKFWRQQKQTSSTAAKVEEKIKTHCLLPSDLPTSAANSSADDI
jgi:hypothetical protein